MVTKRKFSAKTTTTKFMYMYANHDANKNFLQIRIEYWVWFESISPIGVVNFSILWNNWIVCFHSLFRLIKMWICIFWVSFRVIGVGVWASSLKSLQFGKKANKCDFLSLNPQFTIYLRVLRKFSNFPPCWLSNNLSCQSVSVCLSIRL